MDTNVYSHDESEHMVFALIVSNDEEKGNLRVWVQKIGDARFAWEMSSDILGIVGTEEGEADLVFNADCTEVQALQVMFRALLTEGIASSWRHMLITELHKPEMWTFATEMFLSGVWK